MVCIFALGLCGCSSSDVLPRPGQPYAVINDTTLGKFEVVAVDGKAPERAYHWLHTDVPNVVVKPGMHAVTVRLTSPLNSETKPRLATVSALFEDRKLYIPELQNDEITFVERSPLEPPLPATR